MYRPVLSAVDTYAPTFYLTPCSPRSSCPCFQTMALFNRVCVISYNDRPFGAVLPVDVQNHIVCMSWYQAHRKRYSNVMNELRSLPTCRLTDWCSRSTRCFRDTLLLITNSSLARITAPCCAWCRLYATHNESIELRTLDLTLQRRRDDLPPDSISYETFVYAHSQRYADTNLFTITHVLLQMLAWQPPHLAAMDHQRAPRTLPFCKIQRAHFLLWDSFQLDLGVTNLRNPRELMEEHRRALQANVERFLSGLAAAAA